jgi:protein phosphatase
LIPAKRAHLNVAAITDPGRKGKNNEDRYAVAAHRLGRVGGTSSVFAVIADGVGGHRAGEVAADLAVEAISRIVAGSNAKTPLETLQYAFQQANQIISSQAESELTQKGMSTTGACAWVIGNRLYIASVGDSRIYLLRGDRIRQITIDHTWVQEAISSGVLSLEQARDHPNSHVIRRHLGSSQPVVPDFRLRLRDDEDDLRAEANQGLPLRPGDQILICSDGLTDLVEDGEIAAMLRSGKPDRALGDLVELANQRGGHDNITIVLLEVPQSVDGSWSGLSRVTKARLLWLTIGLGSLLLLAGILITGLFWIGTPTVPTATPQASEAPLLQPQVFPGGAPTSTFFSTATEAFQGLVSATPLESAPARAAETQILPTYTPWPTSTPEP